MADAKICKKLEEQAKRFDALLKDKMKRNNLIRKQVFEDVIKKAAKQTNLLINN